jgi:hypothetical protein
VTSVSDARTDIDSHPDMKQCLPIKSVGEEVRALPTVQPCLCFPQGKHRMETTSVLQPHGGRTRPSLGHRVHTVGKEAPPFPAARLLSNGARSNRAGVRVPKRCVCMAFRERTGEPGVQIGSSSASPLSVQDTTPHRRLGVFAVWLPDQGWSTRRLSRISIHTHFERGCAAGADVLCSPAARSAVTVPLPT